MHHTAAPEPSTATSGLVIRTPRRYDWRMWLHARGREGRFRDEEIRLARIREGDRVLDVGCGTGSLPIAAARVVGPSGRVAGVDPSSEMIDRAAAKARRARVAVGFVATAGEALPFPAASFDVVTLSLVLHQLPLDALHGTMAQVRRVLAPGGRLLLVDLDPSNPTGNTVHAHAARSAGSHGHGTAGGQRFDLDRVGLLVEHIGLTIVDRGPIAFRFRGLEPLRYLLGEAPAGS
jgi:ubiquinone/menaquinone biosynthesis C-methylase UbiE